MIFLKGTQWWYKKRLGLNIMVTKRLRKLLVDGDEIDYIKYNSLGSEVAEMGIENGKPFGQSWSIPMGIFGRNMFTKKANRY